MMECNSRRLIVRLYSALAVQVDDQGIYKNLLDEARFFITQPENEMPSVVEISELADECEKSGLGVVHLVRRALVKWGNL